MTEIRKEFQKTQQNVADYLGVTRPAYTAYELGSREPDFETLQKLAEYFDVTTDYLLGRTDARHPEKKPEGRFFYDLDHASEEDLDKMEEYFKFLQSQKRKKNNDE
ncbi:MAG: helix-turn-helix domain-containing protein [Sporolactobacillus sp.]